jgi:hypothetical protein
VCPFDASRHPLTGAALEPLLRFLDLGQRDCVLPAGKQAALETPQSISDDRKQDFLRDSVDANLGNWSELWS